jgi:hypothetical protein
MREVKDIFLCEEDHGGETGVKATLLIYSEPGTGRFAR